MNWCGASSGATATRARSSWNCSAAEANSARYITSPLQHVRRVVGQARAFAACQGHVARMRPALEAVDRERETRAAFAQVRRVDLRQVAQADDLGAGSGARDQRLHLLG